MRCVKGISIKYLPKYIGSKCAVAHLGCLIFGDDQDGTRNVGLGTECNFCWQTRKFNISQIGVNFIPMQLYRWGRSFIQETQIISPVNGCTVARICNDRRYFPISNIVVNNDRSDNEFIGNHERARSSSERLISLSQNTKLQAQYRRSEETHINQSASPYSNFTRPLSYLIIGTIILFMGWVCFGKSFNRNEQPGK